jgi:hypothetical protein
MDPVLLGYFPKQLFPSPDRLRARGIEEIASVSLCISEGPEGWHEAWKHNAWGCFANPDVAWSLVPSHQRQDYWLYAYALYPVEYWNGREKPLDVDAPEVMPLGPEYELVGLDVVSRSAGVYFECSPLSCNMLAEEIATNRYCLFSELNDARELARSADDNGCEPGPYHVLEVWRKRGKGRAP